VKGAIYRDVMTVLSYDRYCSEVVAQTDLLRSCIEGTDLTLPVQSCPGWNLGQLLRHIGASSTVIASSACSPTHQWELPDLELHHRRGANQSVAVSGQKRRAA
jgi:hypothetical protein